MEFVDRHRSRISFALSTATPETVYVDRKGQSPKTRRNLMRVCRWTRKCRLRAEPRDRFQLPVRGAGFVFGYARITSTPMNGRRASGTTTLPSACW